MSEYEGREDELLKRVRLDVHYYKTGRRDERDWIMAWLRTKDSSYASVLADELEVFKDLDDNPL